MLENLKTFGQVGLNRVHGMKFSKSRNKDKGVVTCKTCSSRDTKG